MTKLFETINDLDAFWCFRQKTFREKGLFVLSVRKVRYVFGNFQQSLFMLR
jgi:hypothetical protein